MSERASPFAIGIDVGGTKIAAGIVDCRDGAVLVDRAIPTESVGGPEATLAATVELAWSLLGDARSGGVAIAGIGLGVPEIVDGSRRITSAHVVGWTDRAVRDAFARVPPVVVVADVRAAARAEARFGAGRGVAAFAYITIGTGISSCLVIGGEPFAGARGAALVLASGATDVRCPVCGEVSIAVIEDVASGSALARRYAEATGKTISRAEDVLAAAERSDVVAAGIIESGARALGSAAGQLCNVLDPGLLVIGGGLGSTAGMYWDAFVRSTRAHIWHEATRELPIVHAGLGSRSGLVGAALAAMAANGVRHDARSRPRNHCSSS